MDKIEIARNLRSVNYKCLELKYLECEECPFTLDCDGLDRNDSVFDDTIKVIEDLLKENETKPTPVTAEVKTEITTQSNKYHHLRR